MREVLGFVIGLVLACNAAVLTVRLVDRNTDVFRPAMAAEPVAAPVEGQALVSGPVGKITAAGASTEPLAMPLVLTAVERGVGRATIEAALVEGRRVTISWDGGTPMAISGDGALDLSPGRVELDVEGATWSVDGSARRLTPGAYRIAAAVAVAAGGLAEPRNGVDFEADQQTLVVAQGAVVVRTRPDRLELLGPGSAEISGSLVVRVGASEEAASTVSFSEGPFHITIERAGGTYTVDAVLQGRVTVR